MVTQRASFLKNISPRKYPDPPTKPAVLKNLPTFTSDAVLNFAYGNGKFVAIAGSNSPYQLLYSEDGENWQVSNFAPDTIPWTGLFFANGIFIVFAGSGYPLLAYSNDGINWNFNNSSVCSIATYGNNKYVGILNTGFGVKLRVSNDGINWTQTTSFLDTIPNHQFIDIAYGYDSQYGHIFIAIGLSTTSISSPLYVFYSNGGEAWQKIDMPIDFNLNMFYPAQRPQSVAYGNNKFIAITWHNILYSENGIDWHKTEKPFENMTMSRVVYFNNKFYIFGLQSNSIWVSSDGLNWIIESGFDGKWELGNAGDDKIALMKSGAASESPSLLILEKNIQPTKINFLKKPERSSGPKKITFKRPTPITV